MRITVTGAAGFIGRHVVAELTQRGWQVCAFVHVNDTPGFPSAAAVEIMRGDVRDVAALTQAMSGASAVVSLAARKMDESDSEAVNVGGARNLVAACRAANCARLINISTQSAKLARPGIYGRTKREADEVFARSGLAVTTLRPSLVYGNDDHGAFAAVRRFVEHLPVVPILGDGRWVSAPLHVDDVARAIADCLHTPATIGRTYDLAGPDLLSFDTLIDQIAAAAGRRRMKLHVPFGLSLALMRAVTRCWPAGPVSVSNVLGSNQDTAIDPGPARRDLQFAPRALGEGLLEVLGTADDRLLWREAHRLGKYLLRSAPDREICERYAAAVRTLFGRSDDASVRFFQRHGWSLLLLDAALGVFRREIQLRQRVLLMTALLETTPRYAERFLQAPPHRVVLFAGLMWRGATSALKISLGVLLLPFIPRDRADTR